MIHDLAAVLQKYKDNLKEKMGNFVNWEEIISDYKDFSKVSIEGEIPQMLQDISRQHSWVENIQKKVNQRTKSKATEFDLDHFVEKID